MVFNHERGICLFRILNPLLKKLFPILLFVVESVSKNVFLLFIQMFSFKDSQSKDGFLSWSFYVIEGQVCILWPDWGWLGHSSCEVFEMISLSSSRVCTVSGHLLTLRGVFDLQKFAVIICLSSTAEKCCLIILIECRAEFTFEIVWLIWESKLIWCQRVHPTH